MIQKNKYILQKQIEIGKSISHCKVIYLDINFWLKLRDQESKENDAEKQLLNKLSELVNNNKCVIPISEITFWEILKQTDSDSLKRTAKIIDKLSKGISIVSESERQHIEFVNFVKNKTIKEPLDINQFIWTKLSLNILYKFFLEYNPESINDNFIEFLSDFSFEKIINTLEQTNNLSQFKFKDNVEELNNAKEKYKHENKSFNQMFLSELGGYLEVFEKSLNESMEYIYYIDTGNYPTEEDKQNVNPKSYMNMIYNLSKLNKLTTELPSYRIFPELNASIRWNKNRKYSDGNDTLDFLHASAALPYFDFFFTERELKTIISQRKLDELYKCKVSSNMNEILELLDKI